jgi:Protein of unknown function DUF262
VISQEVVDRAEKQLLSEQRTIAFDTKDYTAELLVGKLNEGEFYIPEYQREFIWNRSEQSKFIESVLIGLPIPFMFAAENAAEAKFEILDGAQRIHTLKAFFNNKLTLRDLEKLNALNGFKFSDLPASQQRRLKNRALRLVILAPTADIDVRFDLFERINSRGKKLNAAELRRGAFPGKFYDIVRSCAENDEFVSLCRLSKQSKAHREGEELVLRYFAYAESYLDFQHEVARFLNRYLRAKNQLMQNGPHQKHFERTKRKDFKLMVNFVKGFFPNGFAKSHTSKITPRVRFEAISVGVHLALKKNPKLAPKDTNWLESEQFRALTTTHASNSGPRLKARIEFVRDKLLES